MTIQNDKALDIAQGVSRKTKSWKNKSVLWSELLERMSTPTRTAETVAEYKAMTRAQQAERKDCGGFVGGYCNNGSRSDIRFRSVLCLDADYADGDLWTDWGLLYGNAAAVYSTHKHTPERPRLRLVVPLARNVSPDEYQAIGRRVSATLGMDKFDDSTYQPQRMMYWPSCSHDGEFVFEHLDAPFLEPDVVLATYHDWRDVSSWPMSSRVAEVIKHTAARQQDPTEKGGLVGAFCRAYTIQEAIEAYVPSYQPCEEPGRYTYTEGSTAAGVVVYDDKFAYSHHGTDPASGQLCNAWDLVRIHKFGALDADCDPDTKASSCPSYKAMSQLASEDDRVKVQLASDRMAEAEDDFSAPVEDGDWRRKLKYTEKGALAQTIENAVTILRYDPKLADKLALNEMSHNTVALSSLPWDEVERPRRWTDADDAALRYYLERAYGLTSKDRIFDAVQIVATENAFHPVRDYLDGCEWDGTPRVETLLIDYLGAEDCPYTRAVTRKTLAAAVARIFRPGCKFDYMLTLRGRQGLGKSTLIAKLGGEWYSDTVGKMEGKEAYEQLMGVWILEMGELASMRKSEVETVKLYISKQADRFRPAYGRRTQEFPRQCIFIGTTNEQQFLRDATGNRRFWVVDTPEEPTKPLSDLTPDMVRQIWGEAAQIYRAGEELYLPRDLEAVAREVQECYTEEDPRLGLVADYLDRLLPEDWERQDIYSRRAWLESSAEGTVRRCTVCAMELWVEALGRSPEQYNRYADGKDLAQIMAAVPGWRRAKGLKRVGIYGPQRYYERMK